MLTSHATQEYDSLIIKFWLRAPSILIKYAYLCINCFVTCWQFHLEFAVTVFVRNEIPSHSFDHWQENKTKNAFNCTSFVDFTFFFLFMNSFLNFFFDYLSSLLYVCWKLRAKNIPLKLIEISIFNEKS